MSDIPNPPYLYDDPRFVYDEECMFYDGGFDATCIINKRGLPRKVGRSSYQSAPAKKQEDDCRVIVDIVISIEPVKLNDKQIQANEIVKKYHLNYGKIVVSIDKIKHQENELNVWVRPISNNIIIPKICIKDRDIKLIPIQTIVSSSMGRIKNPKIIFNTDSIKKK
jgi:hypothetical protein